MEKRQKLIDVWVASDGTEHMNPSACEIHEEHLKELRGLTEQQERNRKTQEEWADLVEFGRQRWANFPHEKEKFLSDLNETIQNHLLFGIDLNWWESVNAKGDPAPFPKIFILSTREIRINDTTNPNGPCWQTRGILEPRENTMAHLLARLGVFESVGEARRSGWNKPLVVGEFWFNKKQTRIQVVED